LACPEEIYCDYEWYDARYEKGDTVYVWVVAKAEDAYPLTRRAGVTLENGAVDMFTQASAAIALCILSLNLF